MSNHRSVSLILLAVLNKCVHIRYKYLILTLVKYGSPYQSHTTKCICVDFRFFFISAKETRVSGVFFAVVLKRFVQAGAAKHRPSSDAPWSAMAATSHRSTESALPRLKKGGISRTASPPYLVEPSAIGNRLISA